MNNPTKIITHHAVSLKHHTHRDVGRWHFERWNGYSPSTIRHDIARYAGYHYVINWDGAIEQCRHDYEEGIHCKGQNFSSIGVCFMGNFDNHLPSPEQMKAWETLRARLNRAYGELPIYPHRKFAVKSCHGKLLGDDYFAPQQDKRDLQLKLIALLTKLITLLGASRMK